MKETYGNLKYISYMLRMWQVGRGGDPKSPTAELWRASLQDPLSGKRLVFANLKELFIFLENEVGLGPETAGNPENE